MVVEVAYLGAPPNGWLFDTGELVAGGDEVGCGWCRVGERVERVWLLHLVQDEEGIGAEVRDDAVRGAAAAERRTRFELPKKPSSSLVDAGMRGSSKHLKRWLP